MKGAHFAFSVLDVEPHAFVIATETGVGTGPTMIAGIGLRGHEALFRCGNVVSRHTKDTFPVRRVDDSPFDNTESSYGHNPLDSPHVAKIAGHRFKNEVAFAEGNSNTAAGVEADGEEVGIIGNVLMGDDADCGRSAGLEATRFKLGKSKRSDGPSEMGDIGKTILVAANMHHVGGLESEEVIREMMDHIL